MIKKRSFPQAVSVVGEDNQRIATYGDDTGSRISVTTETDDVIIRIADTLEDILNQLRMMG